MSSTAANLGFELRQQVRVTGTLADTVLPGLLVLVDVTEVKDHGAGFSGQFADHFEVDPRTQEDIRSLVGR